LVVNPDHRLMIINNVGKGGGIAKTLKFILRLRGAKAAQTDLDQVIAELIRHLIPAQKAPPAKAVAAPLRLLSPDVQRLVVKLIMGWDRLRKEEAEALGKAVAAELGLKLLPAAAQKGDPVENERQRAWARIKEMVARRGDATTIAAAIRDRLNAKYDADEIRQSWLALIEADSIGLIRIFCQIPYRPDGQTDAIASPVIGTYVSRLTHEKYAQSYAADLPGPGAMGQSRGRRQAVRRCRDAGSGVKGNPKAEGRNPKEIRNPKAEGRARTLCRTLCRRDSESGFRQSWRRRLRQRSGIGPGGTGST